VIPEQPPFAFRGRVLAFNGVLRDGRPAILAHLYTSSPLPLTFVLPFAIERTPGTFGTRLTATVPRRTRRLTHITSFALSLRRTYRSKGPAAQLPERRLPRATRLPGVSFPLLRASYRFDGVPALSTTLVRKCHAQ
jgi:hypothetical protein